jgi:Tfp pilus assembly protein PilF
MNKFWISIVIFSALVYGPVHAELINLIPMYGEQEKTEALKKADADFIASIEKLGVTRQEGAKQLAKSGWSYWKKNDMNLTIARFNQAWLLDPENADVYHAFALARSAKGAGLAEVEKYFLLGISKPTASSAIYVDYGRFLRTQKKLDESLSQLNKALQISSTALNARSNISFVHYLKGDFVLACTWAKDAKNNGEALEAGYLEDMCGFTP